SLCQKPAQVYHITGNSCRTRVAWLHSAKNPKWPMRILQIVNSPEMGGAEKLVAEMVPLFAESQETDVLFLRMPETPLLKDLQSKTRGQIISLGMGSVYNPLHIFRLIKY